MLRNNLINVFMRPYCAYLDAISVVSRQFMARDQRKVSSKHKWNNSPYFKSVSYSTVGVWGRVGGGAAGWAEDEYHCHVCTVNTQ